MQFGIYLHILPFSVNHNTRTDDVILFHFGDVNIDICLRLSVSSNQTHLNSQSNSTGFNTSCKSLEALWNCETSQ